jgi:hypothetical protein
MQIPNDPVVWIVLGAFAAAVLGIAIWRRYSVVLRRGDTEVRLERPGEDARAAVSVASKASIEASEVGNITGARGTGAAGAPVDVASGAKIKGSKVGDITGVVQEPPPGSGKP